MVAGLGAAMDRRRRRARSRRRAGRRGRIRRPPQVSLSSPPKDCISSRGAAKIKPCSCRPHRIRQDPSLDDPIPLLGATAVVKRFGGQAAVDGVCFAVHAGEIVGLVGPNGAGKTTMFDLPRRQPAADIGTDRFGRPGDRRPAGPCPHASGARAHLPDPAALRHDECPRQRHAGRSGAAGRGRLGQLVRSGRGAPPGTGDARPRHGAARVHDAGASRRRARAGAVGRPAQAARTRPRADGRAQAAAARRAGRGRGPCPARPHHRPHRGDPRARRDPAADRAQHGHGGAPLLARAGHGAGPAPGRGNAGRHRARSRGGRGLSRLRRA